MRIEGKGAFIELSAGHESEEYSVAAAADSFCGTNKRISIDANSLLEFVLSLERVERDRRGEAHLSAMSPDTFELTIRVIDPLGHVSARILLGHGRYEGNRHLRSRLAIEFGFDPTCLPSLLRQARELLQ
ncbi:MAG TPA: hypothetical protein VE398_09285 [Acidobacteriota bacterium]|nr:hypothetical protein [Acidobacteriota bacterium]